MRDGELDIKQLFTFEKQTKAAEENQKSVKEALRLMRKALKGAIPEIDISEQCSAPYECDFHGYCWNHIPENSIFDLRGNGIKKFDLYRKGIIHLSEVPLEDLNFNQRIQVEGTLKKKNHITSMASRNFLIQLDIQSAAWISKHLYPPCLRSLEQGHISRSLFSIRCMSWKVKGRNRFIANTWRIPASIPERD